MRLVIAVCVLLAGVVSARAEVLDRVIAEVGDQPILWSDVLARARLRAQRGPLSLNEQQQQAVHDTFSQLIDEQLIIQAEPAESVSPEEIDSAISKLCTASQVTREQLLAAARQQGLSQSDYLREIEVQLRKLKAVVAHTRRLGGKYDGSDALARVEKEWLTELRASSYFAILPAAITAAAASPAGAQADAEAALRQAACGAAVAVFNAFAPPTPAVETSGPVKRYSLVGSSSAALEAALAGDPGALDPAQVCATLRRLWALGVPAQLEARAEQTAGGRQITYEVVERPTVRSLFITGTPTAEPPPRDSLKTRVTTMARPGVLREDVQTLRSFYQRRGYRDAVVKPHWLPAGADVDICFTVAPGDPVVLKEIVVRGNKVLTPALVQTILPPAGAPNGRGGVYDPVGLEDTLGAFTNLFFNRGLVNGKVAAHLEPLKPDGNRLVIEVTEGAVYTVDAFMLDGAPPALRAQLDELIVFKPGEIFNRTRMISARQRAVALLTSKGYREVQADLATEIKEPSSIKLTLKFTFTAPEP